ncbi:MAG: MvaI/BcnI family restriction endonuclease [Granulosicoccus sp.]
MGPDTGTFDTPQARQMTLRQLLSLFGARGVSTLYVKALAANDNSKNQIYLAGHLTQLSQLPTGAVTGTNSTSQKQISAGRGVIFTSAFPIVWIDAQGAPHPAPYAKLIYYPQYPEVRFSGFLRGSTVSAGHWMNPAKAGRATGRWLLLGVGTDKQVYTYLVTPDSTLSAELHNHEHTQGDEVLHTLLTKAAPPIQSNRDTLIHTLRDIHQRGWIVGQKLDKHGQPLSYKARNGGGYTLEALLGVQPNGIAEPDFLGYEVKQFGVTRFPLTGAKPTTLLTPEPDGGYYVRNGFESFIRQYGYADKSGKPNRLNFGGRHLYGKRNSNTCLMLAIQGYDETTDRITDANGAVALLDSTSQVAASWSFAKLLEHWKTKHALAVYIPCLRRTNSDNTYSYHYGADIEIGTGTEFVHLLSALASECVYFDPGMKLENIIDTNPVSKRRSQFRINHKHLEVLYHEYEKLNIDTL